MSGELICQTCGGEIWSAEYHGGKEGFRLACVACAKRAVSGQRAAQKPDPYPSVGETRHEPVDMVSPPKNWGAVVIGDRLRWLAFWCIIGALGFALAKWFAPSVALLSIATICAILDPMDHD